MRVLNAEEMREVDRRAIEELGIPGMVLMENAAIGVADALGERFPRARRVAIVCGPGNNGGDGFALARHLDARGYTLDVFLLDLGRRPRGDAGLQLAILERIPLPVAELVPDQLGELAAACARADLVVDALFGTGLARPLAGHAAEVLAVLAAAGRPILAVDLPSGLDASLPDPIGPSLEAVLTVTFAAPKVAHVLGSGAARCGEVVVADLGIPAELVEQAPGNWHVSTLEETAALVPLRPADGHKGTFGHVVVAGGSAGKAGAVVLAARGALRSGAGLVTAAVPAGLASLVDGASFESMTLALPGDDALVEEAAGLLTAFAAGKDAVVLGPGLGRAPASVALVRALAPKLGVPLVLDADGLHALDGELELLARRPAATVLTPHPGEMARLLGTDTAAVQADRPAAALTAARRSGAVVVLKGATTLIASPEGELWINPTGGPMLATGGTGDVLAGMIAAWLAQGFEPLAAARLAVYAHGLAGEALAAAKGPFGVVAADVAETLPGIWRRLTDAAEPAEQGV